MSIDYAPSKLDNGVLLDYGVLDTTAPKVRLPLTCVGAAV